MAVSRKTLKKLRGQRQKATRKGYVSKGSHISKKGTVVKNRGRQTGTRGIGVNPKTSAASPPRSTGTTGVGTSAPGRSAVGGIETYIRSQVGTVVAAMRKKYQGTPATSAQVTAAFKRRYR